MVPRLFPPVDYYRALTMAGERSVIDASVLYDKRQKEVHRYEIADARGVLRLTVPVGKPHGVKRATWADVPVSDHDRWWERHLTALESAYGRTPYFEFLIDRFLPVFRSPHDWDEPPSVIDLVRRANSIICPLLEIPEPRYSTPDDVVLEVHKEDEPHHFDAARQKPYWQVRGDTFGFIPGLSILDLIFNLGPEASLYISR